MLGALRQRKNNPIIAAFLGLIILVFIFFFGNQLSTCDTSGNIAASVNGEKITDREFSSRYSSAYRNYQQQYRQFDRKAAEQMNLRKMVLDSMIDSKLLAEAAKERGLAVDDEALRQEILQNPNFQLNGRFDKDGYERLLSSLGITPAEFEQSIREDLLAEKLRAVVQNGTYVSSAELRQAFEAEKTTVNVAFVRVPVDKLAGKAPLPSDEEAKAWLENTPDAEERVLKYYQKHAATKYNVPKKVRARHILARFEKGGPPDLRQKAVDKITEARQAVTGGMDFAEAAKKYSDDTSKDRGGDLGFFSQGQMVRPFEEAAFGLKPGEISPIVESPFGFHVIKVEEIQEPIERKLEDVKVEIAKELIREEKGQGLAEARAKQIHAAMVEGQELGAIAAVDPDGLTAEETGPFSPGRDYVPRVGVDKALARAISRLTMEKPIPEGPIKMEGAWVVLKLKERKDPAESEFEAARAEVRPGMLFEKRTQLVESWTDALRSGAEVEINPLALSYDEEARAAARRQPR